MAKSRISVVIPYFNAAETIQRTLDSIKDTTLFEVEVIVVDDGSKEPLTREQLFWNSAVPLTVVRLEQNGGQPVACNAGFAKSSGDVAIVLDSDDAFALEWDTKLNNLLERWPPESPLAYAWAVTEYGQSTGSGEGLYTREQFLSGQGRGEYLPMFRGEVARCKGYIDLGTRKRCGTLSYARILEDGPLYIHPEVLRIYYTGVVGSVTKNPFDPRKARDSYRCFQAIRESVERYDRANGLPEGRYLSDLTLREAMYRIFGESRLAGLRFAFHEKRRLGSKKLALLFALAVLPRGICTGLLKLAKRAGFVRNFG
jgi:glycosyltransferase involved in cell wall biosynthesis